MGLERGDRYSRGAVAFHWTIAALVLLNLAIGLLHDVLPRAWKVLQLHKSIGVTILALSVGRLAWRLAHRPPELPALMPAWEKTAARAVHWAFYALLFIMPLTGWIFSSDPEKSRPVGWFGLFDLPALPVSHAIAAAATEGHELLGWTRAALVLIPVLAAVRHHFVLRDEVLGRMLPWARDNG